MPTFRKGFTSEWCKDREEWVHFPYECEGCPKLGKWDGVNLMCRYKWDWEVEVSKNLARGYFSGEMPGLMLDERTWDILRGDPEFSKVVGERDRREREVRERARRLSEESLQGRDDFARQIEDELRAEHRRLHPEDYTGDGFWMDYIEVEEEEPKEEEHSEGAEAGEETFKEDEEEEGKI